MTQYDWYAYTYSCQDDYTETQYNLCVYYYNCKNNTDPIKFVCLQTVLTIVRQWPNMSSAYSYKLSGWERVKYDLCSYSYSYSYQDHTRIQYDWCAYNYICNNNETHLPYVILQSVLCPCASQQSVSLLSAAIHWWHVHFPGNYANSEWPPEVSVK